MIALPTSMFPLRRFAPVFVTGFLAVCAFAAPKPAGKSKPLAKPSSPIPSAKGVVFKGEGGCVFSAKFSAGDSNVVANPFQSLELNKRGDYACISRALENNGINAIVNLISEATIERGPLKISRGFSLSFGSKGGFRAGQILPIVLPKGGTPLSSGCWMDFVQNAREEREELNPGGRVRKKKIYESASWLAQSGSVKIESVSPTRVTFSVKNARFVKPAFGQNQNKARGSFVLNGSGVLNFKIERGIFN